MSALPCVSVRGKRSKKESAAISLAGSPDNSCKSKNSMRPATPDLILCYKNIGKVHFRQQACALAKRIGARVRFMPCNQAPIQQLRPDTLVASPDRLVAELRQADYVLTHSFHGTVLSILFRRPFLAFREVEEPAHPSRTRLLLERFGLGERLVTTQMAGDVEASLRRLLAPLPDLDEPLAALRKQGLDFLRTALEAAKVR